jgi:hypothetical protein
MCLSYDLCHHPHRKSEGKEDMAVAESMRKKSLDSPDETKTFDQGKSQVVSIGDFTITRNTLFPKPSLIGGRVNNSARALLMPTR